MRHVGVDEMRHELDRILGRHPPEERITRYGAGNFGTSADVPVQEPTSAYCVVLNEGANGHTLTGKTRASGAGNPVMPLLPDAILNVPAAPFTDLAIDALDGNVWWFFSDVPLLMGANGNTGVPP